MNTESKWNASVAAARTVSVLLATVLLTGFADAAVAKTQAPAAAPVAAVSNEDCLGCHDDAKVQSADGKSMTVLGDGFARSAHRRLDCTDCHQAALSAQHTPEPLGAVRVAPPSPSRP